MTTTLENTTKQQKLDTSRLKKFAQYARRILLEQVGTRLDQVLTEGSLASRNNPKAVSDLKEALKKEPKKELIERVAYTWFNRFCALRFMDINHYNKILIVSPLEGQIQPEILAEAKGGFIDEEIVTKQETRTKIKGLLDGSITSANAQAEAYSLLLVSVCNYYHSTMPYLFERIDDYTELLLPDDLLSGNSILAYTREALATGTCIDDEEEPIVEVIGWLYQYYISERKDQVFAALKKNKKIESYDIPAATQLFTPNWIVRYLVENSLGRLWMLNKPKSKLIEQMPYYIANDQETQEDYLKINSLEEIRICDPACGSGHMLVYAFDLLYAIYEEEGYEPNEIPSKILTHNLYGIEIDERAGELAAFALTMKARAKYKRFFSKPVQPNICVLENIDFSEDDLASYMNTVGRDLFTAPLLECLRQFKEAKNFGSLIKPAVQDVGDILEILEKKNVSQNVLLYQIHAKVLQALKQADYLSQKYHVVVANPPYMGGKGMNGSLGNFAKKNYPNSKSDMFAMFIERGFELALKNGYSAMVTMQSWMFLSSYEKLRQKLLEKTTLIAMNHMDNMVMSIAFGTAATIWQNSFNRNIQGAFCFTEMSDLNDEGIPQDFPSKNERNLKAIRNSNCDYFYHASAEDFKKIPGSPIAYWVSEKQLMCFSQNPQITKYATSSNGIQTGNNDKYVRFWAEIPKNKASIKWFPYSKGGAFRKWFGNLEYIVNWENNGTAIKSEKNHCARGEEFYFQEGITWSDITSGKLSARYLPTGTLFDAAGPSAFFIDKELIYIGLALLNTKFADEWSKIVNPTLHFQSGDFRKLVLAPNFISDSTKKVSNELISISKKDWDSYENSWDFQSLPLISNKEPSSSLKETYTRLRAEWQSMTDEMKRLEEENNDIFIKAYGLEDELDKEVPLKEITLTCNPYYRYDDKKSPEDLETLLKTDTIKEFISYAVGCMFGRYSLDKPGLILANQGETLADYLKQVPQPSFEPDDDNVIPVLDDNWFSDDISERFRNFLRVSFGGEHYEENLKYIEKSIGKDIRKYFIKDFYNDHIKRYKKRPIYWMFSSTKGSFNVLVYMHRYKPDTVSVILNGYLREYRSKLSSKISQLETVETSADSSQAEKTRAAKQIESMRKIIKELDEYEKDILYPLATQNIELDLDDGVKVNYNKLGKALQKITGLSE
jgi:type II restriction/modification system DNA methylase subunit YeeA